jgi:subtilisin family serine protease
VSGAGESGRGEAEGGQSADDASRLWRDRALAALSNLDGPVTREAVVQEVAVRFADRFEPNDRAYDHGQPAWHLAVLAAISGLISQRRVKAGDRISLTASGAKEAREAVRRLAEEQDELEKAEAARAKAGTTGTGATPDDEARSPEPSLPGLVSGVISPPLRTAIGRSTAGVDDPQEMPVMIELNLAHEGGPRDAMTALVDLWRRVTGRPGPDPLADEYATGVLTWGEMKRLVAADAAAMKWPKRSIHRIWPDFRMNKLIDASVVTVKADAAHRSFNSLGDGIVWAVVDSGIDKKHPHFEANETLTHSSVAKLHRSFLPDDGGKPDDPLVDSDGHGTHVAGIIAGGLKGWKKDTVVVTESRFNVDNPDEPLRQPRELTNAKERLNGMAPLTKLVSLKVLGGSGTQDSRVSRVIQALAYVRELNAESDKLPRIHGVNLSVGYDFDPTWFACGQSPLCQEVDKLVRTGVVVVVAAGNSGFGTLSPTLSTVSQFGMAMTINDPGNAERAITVGATHRDSPHAYGVSYFSSKGPTGDGRRKPDLVAPGERITSAAAGKMLEAVSLEPKQKGAAVYVEDSGTSMAAPHVSGAVAAFLSVRGEFVGRPEEVKRIFVNSATPLGRDPNFEGGGLVDLMRALQSV